MKTTVGRSQTERGAHAVAQERARCATCGGRPELETRTSSTGGIAISARCHGAFQTREIDGDVIDDVLLRDDRRRLFDLASATWFLRNWAGYTIRPIPPKGRRL